jgi:hypothetical protein
MAQAVEYPPSKFEAWVQNPALPLQKKIKIKKLNREGLVL